MPKLGIFDPTVQLLEKSLDLRMRSQQVISSNIANADTPGFTPSRLEFEASLKQALQQGSIAPAASNPRHLPVGPQPLATVQGRVVRTPAPAGLGDGNGVDLDGQMIDLAENQILYEATTQMISKKLGLLKYVAQDGR